MLPEADAEFARSTWSRMVEAQRSRKASHPLEVSRRLHRGVSQVAPTNALSSQW